jgi:hypothetical protein
MILFRMGGKANYIRIAGFGYSFFNPTIRKCGYPVGFDEFSGRYEDLYNQPLMFEPGTALEYGVSSLTLNFPPEVGR